MPNYPMYCVKANITRREMIETIKKQFPKYSKMAQTVVCNPDDYGAQLIPEAEMLLANTYGFYDGLSIKRKHKACKRKKGNSLHVRLDDTMYARFEAVFQRSSFISKQDMLEAAISLLLGRYEEGAA